MDAPHDPGSRSDLLASLTPAQREAAAHLDGPLLILAGPGSGKTRVVTHRVANLLEHGVRPGQILALTFTNKAADEMRQRVERLTDQRGVWMGTFHSFCARLLRRYAAMVGLNENYSIFDTDDSRRVLKAVLTESSLEITHTTPESIASAISWAKNNLITAEDYVPRPGSPVGAVVQRLYPAYQQRLIASNAVDFDDLLLHIARLLRENPELRRYLDERYRYILVDEYQDTNMAQYAIVRALSIDYPNLAVTGDPDQSIYGWRGANLNNILEFEKDFENVRVVRLEQNFRSTPNILRVADQLILHNVRRKAKRLYTDNPEGAPVRLVVYPTGRDEADAIAGRIAEEMQREGRKASEFAVFYRINALSRSLEHALRSLGIPYQVVNGLEFYQRKEIKDILAYLHLLNNPRNDFALLRIINTPTRGIGKKSIERLMEHARVAGLSLLDAAREAARVSALPKRSLSQINKFVACYDDMAQAVGGALSDLMICVLDKSGYRRALVESGSEEDLERLANIDELVTAAGELERQMPEEDNLLERFLEQASLVADTDALDPATERVTLMTMHAAKGLEFPTVFIIAAEQGLLPHERSLESENQLEEERRLLFVGLTRAERELQLSLVQYRVFRGESRPVVPSQFLMELPREEMQYDEPVSFHFGDGDDQEFDEGDDDYEDFDPGYDALDDDDHKRSPKPKRSRQNQAVWSDDDFVQDAPDPFPELTEQTVATAAELARTGTGKVKKYSPHIFQRGMLVTHPEYGTGKILAVSGTGMKRRVRVCFDQAGDARSFLVAHSPLEPLLAGP
jgi:DNA helicase-2/ATP-dependent DNA helicase PcrA